MHPKSMTTSSPGSTRRVARARVGLGRVGPGGDDRVEAVAAGAAAAHLDLEVEREVALGGPVVRARAAARASASSAIEQAAWMRGDLARLLHPPQLLDQALGGDELVTGERLREARAAAPR